MRFDVNDMINRFATMWGEPKTDNVDVYLHEYHRALGGTDPDLLEAATNACIDTETYWPRVAVVRKHIEIASYRRTSQTPLSKRSGYTGPNHYPASIIIRPTDPSWKDWMREIQFRSGKDVREQFEAAGEIDAQARWPRSDVPSPRLPGEAMKPAPEGHPNHVPPPPSPEMKARVAELLAKGKAALKALDEPVEAKKNYWRDVTRPAFEDMQRNSPNQFLHRNLRNPAGGN